MKRRGIMGMLLLGLLLIGITACGSDDKETTNQQPTESDTIATITADGNIEALYHANLTFSSGGKIDKISVQEGDKVKKGDTLAKLDASALELALAQAQSAELQAQVALSEAKLAQIQAQDGLAYAKINLIQVESDLLQAEAAVFQAETAQAQAQIALDIAEDELDDAQDLLDRLLEYYSQSDSKVKRAQSLFDKAELEVEATQAQVEATQIQLLAAHLQLEAAQGWVAVADLQYEIAVVITETADLRFQLAQANFEVSRLSLAEIQRQLNEATIVAPFDGTVSRIGLKEGEFLSHAAYAGTTIVEIVDLRRMELTARIDEIDVIKVKTGQKVTISIDAMPEMKLEGQVTFISPVAKEPVGVVLFEDEDEDKTYEVKIDFDTPEDSLIRAGMSATAEIIVD